MKKKFTKEDMRITDKHMKICSPSFVTWEMQIKITVKYHYVHTREAIIKKMEYTKC